MKNKTQQPVWLQILTGCTILMMILSACGLQNTQLPADAQAPQPTSPSLPAATNAIVPNNIEEPAAVATATVTPIALSILPPLATPTLPIPPTVTPIPATSTPNAVTACEGAPPIAHKIGDTVMINPEPPEPNALRDGPGSETEVIGSIKPGEMANVVGGPVCANNYTWWQVETERGLFGWTAEGDPNNYWLIKLPNAHAESCTASGGIQLEVGKKVMVSLEPPVSQYLLKMPGKRKPIITNMEIGTQMTIIGEHACMDGYIYWKVQTETGLIGWTAQSDSNGTLWLVDPVEGARAACTNSPPPHMEVGKRGAVTNDTDLNNIVRAEPDRKSPSLGEMPPGTSFEILEGPTCGKGYYWWKVQTDDGLIGWTPEGDANEYWLTMVHDIDRSGTIQYLSVEETIYIMQVGIDSSGLTVQKKVSLPERITLLDDTVIELPLAEDMSMEKARWLDSGAITFIQRKPILVNKDEINKHIKNQAPEPSPEPVFDTRDIVAKLNINSGIITKIFHARAGDRYIVNYGDGGGIVEIMDLAGKHEYYRGATDSPETQVDKVDLAKINAITADNPAGTYHYETCAHEPEHLSSSLYVCIVHKATDDSTQIAEISGAGPRYYALWLDEGKILIWETKRGKLYVAPANGSGARLVARLGIPQSAPVLLPDGNRLLVNYNNAIYVVSVEDLLQFIYNARWVTNGIVPLYIEPTTTKTPISPIADTPETTTEDLRYVKLDDPETILLTLHKGQAEIVDTYKLELVFDGVSEEQAQININFSERESYDGMIDPSGVFITPAPTNSFSLQSSNLLDYAQVLYRTHRNCTGTLLQDGKAIRGLGDSYSNFTGANRFYEHCIADGSFDIYYEEYLDYGLRDKICQ